MLNEMWKSLDEYDGELEISNYGNVRYKIDSGSVNIFLNTDGYYQISKRSPYSPKYPCIHRLVAKYFVDNPESKSIVNHIDNNPLNNHYINLEWVTHRENTLAAIELGAKPRHTAILCEESGIVYKSIKDVSRQLNIRYESLRYVLKHNTPIHGLHFRRIKE